MIDSADSDSRIDLVSPLAGCESGGVLDLREIAARGKIILRGDAADSAFCEAAQKTLGVAPPQTPNTTATAADVRVLWLGPDEWMVWCDWRRRLQLRDDLQTALSRFALLRCRCVRLLRARRRARGACPRRPRARLSARFGQLRRRFLRANALSPRRDNVVSRRRPRRRAGFRDSNAVEFRRLCLARVGARGRIDGRRRPRRRLILRRGGRAPQPRGDGFFRRRDADFFARRKQNNVHRGRSAFAAAISSMIFRACRAAARRAPSPSLSALASKIKTGSAASAARRKTSRSNAPTLRRMSTTTTSPRAAGARKQALASAGQLTRSLLGARAYP